MQKILFILISVLVIVGCKSTEENKKLSIIEQELNGSDPTGTTTIPDSDYGNVRIAFLTNRKLENKNTSTQPQSLGITSSNISLSSVLIHKNNKQYLKLVDEYQGYKYDEIPLSAFSYQADSLPLTRTRSIVIIEDILMSQLLNMAKKDVAFFNYAKNISKELVNNPAWPKNDTILIEENGRFYAMEKPASLGEKTGTTIIPTPEGRAYLALKNNILLSRSRSAGYTLQIIDIKKMK